MKQREEATPLDVQTPKKSFKGICPFELPEINPDDVPKTSLLNIHQAARLQSMLNYANIEESVYMLETMNSQSLVPFLKSVNCSRDQKEVLKIVHKKSKLILGKSNCLAQMAISEKRKRMKQGWLTYEDFPKGVYRTEEQLQGILNKHEIGITVDKLKAMSADEYLEFIGRNSDEKPFTEEQENVLKQCRRRRKFAINEPGYLDPSWLKNQYFCLKTAQKINLRPNTARKIEFRVKNGLKN